VLAQRASSSTAGAVDSAAVKVLSVFRGEAVPEGRASEFIASNWSGTDTEALAKGIAHLVLAAR
jgi:hypothetical protein